MQPPWPLSHGNHNYEVQKKVFSLTAGPVISSAHEMTKQEGAAFPVNQCAALSLHPPPPFSCLPWLPYLQGAKKTFCFCSLCRGGYLRINIYIYIYIHINHGLFEKRTKYPNREEPTFLKVPVPLPPFLRGVLTPSSPTLN